jgi:Prenyltransferase and squalene oxidase repeat
MNAFEMPDQLQVTKPLSTLRNDCLSLLESQQNADGGWGFHAGEHSRVEPTDWALRALSHSAGIVDGKNLGRATGFLRSRQLPDGSWPACAEMSAGSWITSLTCSVLAADSESAKNVTAGLKWLCDDFPRDSNPWRRFLRRIRNESHLAKQNDSYRGWGWTPKTSSWVEPTAFALMALHDAAAGQLPDDAAQRRELAVALLYDRMCPGGGWNCGNPNVYGVDGEALVLPTCWALLALREAQEKPGRALSLAWLQKEFANIESAASLAVARMTLENYGIERQASSDTVTPPAKRELQDWSAQELAEQGTHVLAWASMSLNPARPWPAVAAKA